MTKFSPLILILLIALQISIELPINTEVLSAVIEGATLAGTTIDQIAQGAKCNRFCAIEIRNYHYTLELKKPRYYLVSGTNQDPPPPVIRSGSKEACLFRKISDTATGSVGVLSYEIHKVKRDKDNPNKVVSTKFNGDKLYLMWSIPYDYNLYDNWHAVGITKKLKTSKATFVEMYEKRPTCIELPITPQILSTIIKGASLAGTTIEQIAKGANCNRFCAIEIRNYHYTLELKNPNYYLVSGTNQNPPPPLIRSGYKEACLFRKIYDTATGSVGILSYEIYKVKRDNDNNNKVVSTEFNGDKLFLMWSIPYDYNLYGNWHAVGITKKLKTSKATFDEMYEKSPTWFARKAAYGTSINYKSESYGIPIEIIATLSDVGSAMWIIDFS
ncbi:hemolytic toxin Avt-1-like protein [Dinothrombium tinctorium]|uniref:Hemolytic toxin Avt-1-like protein n=1 Tax=Dinothrombium tinctorium TaxID=1965070 RepID=A0A3S3PLX6_9ACAR|nr:hemolytic toxin Avt-1-like protein [Dinothrombium tinctorium]